MRVPYIRFWLNDFYDATSHLEHDVRNTYHATLDVAYMTGQGSLPNDERAIRHMLGISPKKWANRRAAVMAFWTLSDDGRLHNKRLDLEWRKATDRAFRDKVQPRERSPLGFPNGVPTEPNSPAITTRARAAASEAREELSALKAERVLPAVATEVQPAASLCVRAHATRPAPNGGSHPPTTQEDPEMPLATADNGAAVFLIEGSDEWLAYEAATGDILQAHSTHSGYRGRWVRPNPTQHVPTPVAASKNTAFPDPTGPALSDAERQRVGERFDALMADLKNKNQPPQTDPAAKGATSEERERAAAQARLEQLKGMLLPPISSAAAAAINRKG